MSFKGMLELDGNSSKQYRILNFNVRINQKMDQTGRPNANPGGGLFVITIESTRGSDFLDWVISPDMTKNGKIIFNDRDSNAQSLRTSEFTEAFCVDYVEDFSSESSSPMKCRIVISAKHIQSGTAEFEKKWDKI